MWKTIGKDSIPLLISILIALISIGTIIATDYILNYKHYIGIGLIGISCLLYFKNKKGYFIVYGLTLVLGIIDIIDIYYRNFLFGIGPIKFNPIFLVLFIFFLVLSKDRLSALFPEKEFSEQKKSEIKAEKEKLVKMYERKFESKTVAELKNIATENSEFVNEAKIAANNILRIKYKS